VSATYTGNSLHLFILVCGEEVTYFQRFHDLSTRHPASDVRAGV
jgi:hypothetical protein